MKNYYQILGLPVTATEQEIKKAFRQIAKENHPDTHPGDAAAEERFKQANEAYEILGDSEKRQKYIAEMQNLHIKKGKTRNAPDPARPPVDFSNINFGDMFKDMFQEMGQKEADRKQTNNEKDENPINVDDLFSKFMGFKP